MKFAISSEQRDYFTLHQAIELENLLPPVQLAQLQENVDTVLHKHFDNATPEQLFNAGRDLWKRQTAIRKIVTHDRLATLVAELTEQKTLRLAFDQYLPAAETALSKANLPDPYHRLLRETHPLADHCSVQGIICGLMLCLKGSGSNQEELTAFPHQAGHGVFFTPEFPIAYPTLYHRRDHAYLLIVYASHNAVYIHQELDPHSTAFKTAGYTYGDKLKDKWNPIIYRS